MKSLTFRPGRQDEAELFNEMTLAGVRFYDHPNPPPNDFADLAAMLEAGNPDEVITVAEHDGEVIGFYGLVVEDDFVELLRMFLAIDRIGRGYGRTLWRHAVESARRHGERLRILADPGARGFYEAMGAELDREVEAYPGFVLGLYWYELTDSA